MWRESEKRERDFWCVKCNQCSSRTGYNVVSLSVVLIATAGGSGRERRGGSRIAPAHEEPSRSLRAQAGRSRPIRFERGENDSRRRVRFLVSIYAALFSWLVVTFAHHQSHLKEDLKDVYTEEQISRMTEQELDFHYFKLILLFISNFNDLKCT